MEDAWLRGRWGYVGSAGLLFFFPFRQDWLHMGFVGGLSNSWEKRMSGG